MSRITIDAVRALLGRGWRRRAHAARTPIATENSARGSRTWRIGAEGTRAADDVHMQVKGFASAAGVNVGESIDFHVTVSPEQDFTVAIFRLGYYGGDGARHMVTSPWLRGVTQPEPDLDPATGMISCRWPPACT